MSGVTYSKTWSNGETLTHTDLNANFTAVNTAVGAASGLASLNSSSLVVEDPANATATKAAGKICKWGTSEAFQCSALTATTVGCAAITSTSTIQGTQVTSTIADGTAPVITTSKTVCTNLTSGALGDGTNRILTKIVDIGEWNMNTVGNVNVAHGIANGITKVMSVFAKIKSDAGSAFEFLSAGQTSTFAMQGSISWDDTNVALYRLTGGTYDSTFFEGVGNRGNLTIVYIE